MRRFMTLLAIAAWAVSASPAWAQTPATQTGQPSTSPPSPVAPTLEPSFTQMSLSTITNFTHNLSPYYETTETRVVDGITIVVSCQWYYCDATASGGSNYLWTSNWNTISTSSSAHVSFPGEQALLYDLSLYVNGVYWVSVALHRGWAADNEYPHINDLDSSCTSAGYCTLTLSASDPEGAPMKVSWDWDANGTFDQSGIGLTTVQHNFGVVDYSRVRIRVEDPFFYASTQVWRVYPSHPVPSFTSSCYDDRNQDDPPDHTFLQCTMTYSGNGPTPTAYHWYWQTPDGQWWKANSTSLTAVTVRWNNLNGSTALHPVWLAVEWNGSTYWYTGTAPIYYYW